MTHSSSHVPSADSNPAERIDAAEHYFGLWRRGERPSVDTFLQEAGTLAAADLAAVLRVDQRERWRSGECVRAESYLQRHPTLHADAECAVDLIYNEFLLREKLGERPTPEEYVGRFPHYADVLGPQIELHRAMAAENEDASQLVTAASRAMGVEPDEPLPRIPGYEVLGVLGRGGMGVVYQARQTALHRLVALKMLRAGALADVEHRQRFEAEAAAVGRLRHPNIVQVHDYGSYNRESYLVLEYVEGGMLAQKIAGVPQPLDSAAETVETLALAMEHAHGQGLVHRDLKPANVLITAEGVLKITDFGLAKHLTDERGSPNLEGHTLSGALVGTPRYMAPEQIEATYGVIGPATDVYALGVILYELLTGRPPFHGDSVLDLLQKIQEQDPPPPSRLRPRLPRDLETICLKCLHKEPARRYLSAAALAEDLGRFRAGEPIRARPPGLAERVVKWVRRRPTVAALLALVVLVSALGLTAAAVQYGRIVQHAAGESAAKHDAERNLAEAHTELYFASLALAEREWRDGSPRGMQLFLSKCPPYLRGWEWHYLHGLSERAELTLRGHTSQVTTVSYSPDGRHLASGGQDNRVKVWNARTGAAVWESLAHTFHIQSLAFSGDSRWLASGSRDGTVRLWDVATGAEKHRLVTNAGEVRGVAFFPDGRRVAAALGKDSERGRPSVVQIWDIVECRLVQTLSDHKLTVNAVACHPDGNRLASASEDGLVRVWDTRAGSLLRTLTVQRATPAAARPEEQITVSIEASADRRFEIRLRSFGVEGVVYSPDGQRLAACNSEGVLQIWEAETGRTLHILRAPQAVLEGLAFSPDGRRLATAGQDRHVRLWDVVTGREVRTYRGHLQEVYAVAFHPDGDRIASAGGDRLVKIWDPTQEQGTTLLGGHTASVFGLAFSPDGRRLAAGSGDLINFLKPGAIKVWELETRRELFTLRGHKGGVSAVACSPDGQRLASTSSDGTVKVWNLETGQELRTLRGHSGNGFCVAFSPDGRWLASGSGSFLLPTRTGEAKLWNAETGEELYTLRGHQGTVGAVVFSPDGRWLATAGADKTIRLWEAATGAEVRTLHGHTSAVIRLAFSPDSHWIASGSGMLASPTSPGEVKLWDAATGAELRSFQGHTQMICGVAFDRTAARLVTSSRDGTVKLWDTRTGRQAASLRASDRYICSLAVSPDGGTIASGNWFATVNLWHADLPREN